MGRSPEPLVHVEGDSGVALLLQDVQNEAERTPETVAVHRKTALAEVHDAYTGRKHFKIKNFRAASDARGRRREFNKCLVWVACVPLSVQIIVYTVF